MTKPITPPARTANAIQPHCVWSCVGCSAATAATAAAAAAAATAVVSIPLVVVAAVVVAPEVVVVGVVVVVAGGRAVVATVDGLRLGVVVVATVVVGLVVRCRRSALAWSLSVGVVPSAWSVLSWSASAWCSPSAWSPALLGTVLGTVRVTVRVIAPAPPQPLTRAERAATETDATAIRFISLRLLRGASPLSSATAMDVPSLTRSSGRSQLFAISTPPARVTAARSGFAQTCSISTIPTEEPFGTLWRRSKPVVLTERVAVRAVCSSREPADLGPFRRRRRPSR